jgi:hypothetical protein
MFYLVQENSKVQMTSIAPLDHADILSNIARLQTELDQIKATCTAAGLTVPVAKSSKKRAAASGEKRPANVWIQFTQRVSSVLTAADITVGPATVGKQFASSLKDKKDYASWTDEEIVAAWGTWEKPEQSKMSKKGSAASSETEEAAMAEKTRKPRAKLTDEQKAANAAKRAEKKAASASEAPSAEEDEAPAGEKTRKPRAKLTDEQKAANAAKRAEKKAASASEAPSAAEDEAPAGEKTRKPRAKLTDEQKAANAAKRAEKKAGVTPRLPASSVSSDAEAHVEPSAPAKMVLKRTTYTLEQLADFDSFNYEGVNYGRNVRNDVATTDGEYAGHWNGKTINKGTEPADWNDIMRQGE